MILKPHRRHRKKYDPYTPIPTPQIRQRPHYGTPNENMGHLSNG